jgi:hypothetical protein
MTVNDLLTAITPFRSMYLVEEVSKGKHIERKLAGASKRYPFLHLTTVRRHGGAVGVVNDA